MAIFEKSYITVYVFQTLAYMPNINHHERKLYCVYTQRDEHGQELYIREAHVTISIFYLEEPEMLKRELPEVEVKQTDF